jgi:beta-lactam-binding protein with PASTA domain
MPTRIFAVTSPRDTVIVDSQGRAEVSFTASNTAPKPITGRAKLVPVGSTKEGWLTLDGDQERKFAKGEAHQFTARIAVPPGTPAGKYAFRLNIISVENPDEEFTEGPSVSFEVKELAPAAPPKRKFPWWIVAVAGVLVIGAGLITWLLVPKKVAVPEMIGMTYQEAVKSLDVAKLKLSAKETKVTGIRQPGIVVEQSPQPRKLVPVGSGVTLVVEVAPQMISVPKIIGESVEEAKELLTDLVYEQVGEKITGKFSPGVVVEQNPARGTKVPPGTKVAAFVEAESVQVPGLIGQSPAQAEPIVKKAQLQLKTEAKSTGGKPGTIVDQNPKADARVAPGTVVTAFVQPEPEMVTVPDVIGVPADKVAPMFEGRKLQYYVIGQRIITGKVPVGAIAHQSPDAGQRVGVGTRVELAAEAESVQVPNVVGKTVNEAFAELDSVRLYGQLEPGGAIGRYTRIARQSPKAGTPVAPYIIVTMGTE